VPEMVPRDKPYGSECESMKITCPKSSPEKKEPPGWKGKAFYPNGFGGDGFGISVLPNGSVSFPVIKTDLAKAQEGPQKRAYPLAEHVSTPKEVQLPTPRSDVTDNSVNLCVICGRPAPGKRIDRRYCSAKCRKKASRGKSLLLAGNQL
jgi:hypothetical protein